MDLRHYLAALRKSWLLVLACTLLGTLVGAAVYLLTPTTYASSVQFYVSTPVFDGTNAQQAGQFAQQRVNSYVLLLSSQELAKRVIADTDVVSSPAALAAQVHAVAEVNTVIVTATVQDRDARRALRIATGVADNFPAMVDELDNQGTNDNTVRIEVVSGPGERAVAVAPVRRTDLALGLGAGLLLGLVLAVGRELLDTSVQTVDAAQALVGAPVLATIGFSADARRSPLVVGDQAGSVRAESFRQLRTGLQFVDAAASADVVVVTSSVPSEGKSSVAANLALSLTESGLRVCLIEGDLRRPRLADYLGVDRAVGLTNVLAGQVALNDAMQLWGDPGLSFLASGSVPPNPSELLGSAPMAELVATLRSAYDKVVIDTPPLLPVTDAAVAAGLADGVVVVVRHGRTTRAQLGGAVEVLRRVNARVLGTVLNMRRIGRAERSRYGDAYDSVEPAGRVAAAVPVLQGSSTLRPASSPATPPRPRRSPTR